MCKNAKYLQNISLQNLPCEITRYVAEDIFSEAISEKKNVKQSK